MDTGYPVCPHCLSRIIELNLSYSLHSLHNIDLQLVFDEFNKSHMVSKWLLFLF